jgi:acetolactate synthase-1/2/3 large subunit
MIAKAFGIPAKKVTMREYLQDSIKDMLDSEGPFLLEIIVEKEGNVFPMVEPGSSVSEVRLTY